MPGPWDDLHRPPLRVDALRRALLGPWRQLDVVDETGSTNADLVRRARTGEPGGLVLVAEHQSAGRGRLDRTWTFPPRAGLAVSALLDLPPGEVPPARLGWLPLLAGVAMAESLVAVAGLAARLKWPNDVLVPGPDGAPAKVCGVLCEVVSGPATSVVVGAGLNVSQTGDELPAPGATSLLLAGAATTDRDTLLRAYLRALATRFDAWRAAGGDPRASGLGATYREACATLGQRVRVQLPDGGRAEGVAEEVDDDARLRVRTGDGEHVVLAAGDVVHVRPA